MGWRDNCHSDIGFRVPEGIWIDEERRNRFIKGRLGDKQDYIDDLKTGQSNWQDARAVLPISACHRWSMAMNYMALTGFMSQRLMFSEQADTVATAWLMRERIKEKFPLLASYLRPSSDWAKRCLEHVGDEMAQSFGNLFRCSGRWPCELASEKYSFNTACSDRNVIMRQLSIYIPEGSEDLPNPNVKLENLEDYDRRLFNDS